jgi:hypothetical protein
MTPYAEPAPGRFRIPAVALRPVMEWCGAGVVDAETSFSS